MLGIKADTRARERLENVAAKRAPTGALTLPEHAVLTSSRGALSNRRSCRFHCAISSAGNGRRARTLEAACETQFGFDDAGPETRP